MITQFLLKYLFRHDSEYTVFFGSELQSGTITANFRSSEVWRKETLKKKLRSIFALKYEPSKNLIRLSAKATLIESVFGNESNYGETLLRVNEWHNSRKWELHHLSEFDNSRAKSVSHLSILVRTRHREVTSRYLELNIADKSLQICVLIHPMVVKVPVISILHYIDIHCAFTFNEIRKAGFKNADVIIGYIYEIQYIQQKIALSLHELLYLIDYNEKHKNDALLLKAEMSAIMTAETIFSYLKASIEKTIALLGLIFDIKDLDSRKNHGSKISYLEGKLPQRVKEQFYYDIIMEFFRSENISELNNYRTGILHKRGIADLQPHNYVAINSKEIPLKKIFDILIDQHSKNSAALLCTYAILTDELVKIDPPSISPFDLPH
jgi:hypothetical protein